MAEVVLEAVSGAEKRRQALPEVRRRDSDAKRAHVRDTVEKMLLASERITFAAVARRAKVSSWLVYAEAFANRFRQPYVNRLKSLQRQGIVARPA